jgi:hypothetical protein
MAKVTKFNARLQATYQYFMPVVILLKHKNEQAAGYFFTISSIRALSVS